MTQRVLEKLERMNVIELYNNGTSLNELEKIVHSDKRTIRDYLLANGVKVKGVKLPEIIPTKESIGLSKSERRFNCKKFDIIDTEEKAYWLGFLMADGNISSDLRKVELGLQACDVAHLHKFNRFMECEDNNVHYHPKITESKVFDGYRWSMTSEHLCTILNSYGCTPKKSLTLKFPDLKVFKDPSLVQHFIRGYWDGDGCLCFTYKTHGIDVLGTKEFLEVLKKYLPLEANIILHKNQTYTIKAFKENAYKIANYLYKDASVYLDRKYNKYLDFCRAYEESYVELETQNGKLCDENTVLS